MEELEMYLMSLDNRGNSKKNTIDAYRMQLNKWFEFANVKNFNDITKVLSYDIEKYDTYLKNKGLSVNTRFAYTYPICGFYKYLVDRKLVEFSPYNLQYKIKNKKEATYMEKDLTIEFINACTKLRDKAMFSLACETGMRYCEITSIKIEDIISDDGYYYVVVMGKGSKERTLGFSETTYNYIMDYIDHERAVSMSTTLFTTKTGKSIANKEINYTVRSVAKKANIDIDGLHFHSLRHGFCSMQISSGANIKEVQTLMGHSSIDTTLRIYSHIDEKKLAKKMSANSLLF